ncbi:MAG: amino acid adenylation domain-containing protein, partial [bacterium]|nr:amino acid adenylation domain-containing protein [bacterium]
MNKPGKISSKEMVIAAGQSLEEKKYWLNKLAGELERSAFPGDKTPVAGNKRQMGNVNFLFSDELFERAMTICGGDSPTLHMILVAGLALLLNKYTGSRDIIITTPIDSQETDGEYINTLLPLRIFTGGDNTFKELLYQVKDTIDEAIENQNYPVEVLVCDELGLSFDHDHSLFDVAILLENIQDKEYISHIGFNMIFSFVQTPGSIRWEIEFNTLLYEKSTIERIARHFSNLLKETLFNADSVLVEIGLLSGEEKKQLLEEFNDTQTLWPTHRAVHQLFQHQVERNPENPALESGSQRRTYGRLNGNANRLARLLIRSGIGEDRTVGILLNRSVYMVESILAVWKAGGAYIPIDCNYPPGRISEILKDSAAPVLITLARHLQPGVEEKYNGTIIKPDEEMNRLKEEDNSNPNREINMNSLAYVIYTSGSTGRPKGVMVEHKGMLNHMQAKIADLALTPDSIVAQNASHTFDISVWQFFSALAVGGKTILYPYDIIMDPEQFIHRVIADGITILEVVPSYLGVLLDSFSLTGQTFRTLEYLLVTGEAVKPELVNRWFRMFPRVKMMNAYGPTEASDDITHYVLEKELSVERVPIGKPLQNLDIYIVDKEMNLLPVNVKGEICVSGIGVGRGYLNDAGKTQQAFHSDPFKPGKENRLYKTGDFGRWLPDGNIEFFGRMDYQVKIRGFRI